MDSYEPFYIHLYCYIYSSTSIRNTFVVTSVLNFDKLIWRTIGPISLALHSSLFGPDGVVNFDYIVTNSINSLLIGSRCIPNTH